MIAKTSLAIFAILGIINLLVALSSEADELQVEETIKHTLNYDLPLNIVPIHYNIELVPHLIEYNFTFDGESTVKIAVKSPTSNVVLQSRNLIIHEAFTSLTRENGRLIKPTMHELDDITDILTLKFDTTLEPGVYILRMKFRGTLCSDLYGFYRSSYIDDNGDRVWLAATHFQPTSARRAFPCWDEPALKATFNVSIKHYTNYTALSNMPVYAQSEVDETDGKVWTHFETTPVMSTNILAFVVSDFVRISHGRPNVSVWCRKNAISSAQYFLDYAEKAMDTLQDYLNSTVRVPKIDHVVIPDYSSRATENWGLILYRESIFLYNESSDPTSLKHESILTGTHELAHMWFGNLVSPASWKYLWLSEGFAAYFKPYISDKIIKDCRLLDLFVVGAIQARAFPSDVFPWALPINREVHSLSEIRSVYSVTTYVKAPAILRMLSHIVSDDVFRTALIKYIDAHQYSAVTSDDLWNAFQSALDESNVPHVNFTIKEVMDTWIEQSGFPLVTVTRDYITGETKVSQTRYTDSNENRDTIENSTWWVPLNFATRTNPNFSSTLPTNWLAPQDEEVSISGIDIDDWVIVNIQETGFYRVNYDTINWRKIAKYLNSDDYAKVHVINRAQLIDDASELLQSKRIDLITFLELTSYLSRETDYIPWYAAFRCLSALRSYIRIPKIAEIITPYVLDLMNNLIESVGFEIHADDNYLSNAKKCQVLQWACTFGHAQCYTTAHMKLVEHLQDPHKNRIPPDLRPWVYCMGLSKANESVWNQVLDLYRMEPSSEILEYLGCSEDPIIINNYLNMSISENSPIFGIHSLEAMLFTITKTPVNINVTLDFIIENEKRITSYVDNYGHLISTVIDGIGTKEQLDKAKLHLKEDKVMIDVWINEKEKILLSTEVQFTRIRDWLESRQTV